MNQESKKKNFHFYSIFKKYLNGLNNCEEMFKNVGSFINGRITNIIGE